MLNIEIQPGQRWAVLGSEADAFREKLPLAKAVDRVQPGLDGILLAGALSDREEPAAWLQTVIASLQNGATLVVIDWQYDGPLDGGPDLERRFKRGKLSRLLRQWGFGRVETVDDQARCYVVWAIKGPPSPQPHAGEFVAVATLDELPKNGMKRFTLFGREIIVANTGKEIVAFDRACPHANSPLDQGLLRGRKIVCRQHAYMWDVQTGEPVEPADEDILRRHAVKVDVDRGQILVALAPPTFS